MVEQLKESEFYDMYFPFLRARGLNAEKIPRQLYKTPDLKIFNEHAILLNEVKIPELIFDPIRGVYVFKTMHSKLLDFINTALKQLEAYDNQHKAPWVITFAANHMQMNWKKFADAIQGGVEFDGSLNPDFTSTDVFKRMKIKILLPDLYIWFQVSETKEKLFQVSYFINPKSPHLPHIRNFVAELRNRPLGSMDNELMIPL